MGDEFMDHTLSDQIGLKDWLQYIFLLIFVRYGFILRRYSDPHTRKWSCTALGLFMAAVLSNTEFWHYFIFYVLAIGMVKLSGPKFCHIATFTFVFAYLIIYRITVYQRGVVVENLQFVIQATAALNVIGVAIEINMAHKMKSGRMKNDFKKDPTEDDMLRLTFMDIFHYVFSFVVCITGPYVRYQVYSDFIHLPYSRVYRRSLSLAVDSFVYTSIFVMIFTTMNEIWPIHYVLTSEFAMRSFIYRLSYCIIQWFRFRMNMYMGFTVTNIITKISGLGAYPVENKSLTSYGPTINNNNFRNVTYEQAKEIDLDMNTVNIKDIWEFEFSPTITEATRHWNKAIQYWLGVYIYKSLPKKYFGRGGRIFITLMVSTLWHGIYPTMIFSSTVNCYYYMTESYYWQLSKNFTGWKLKLFNLGLWISRTYFWAWSMMGYLLLDMDTTMGYYKSTYFVPLIFTAFMHLLYACVIQPRLAGVKSASFRNNNNVTNVNGSKKIT